MGLLSAGQSSIASWALTSTGCGILRLGLPKSSRLIPRSRRTSFDWLEPARQLRIDVDQNEARRIGYSSEALSAVLNTAISGTAVTQLRDGIYLVNVVARAEQEHRVALDTLRTLQVPLPNGRTVALSQFATFSAEQEQPIVWRRNRIPTLTVQSDVAAGRIAGQRRARSRAEDRCLQRAACRRDIVSKLEASPRRARPAGPRCWLLFPSCCF